MRRISPAIPVSPDVLRHFAVLTLVITGGLALFASGENQQAIVGQVKQRQMETDALRAERQRATQHTVVVDGLRVAPGTRLSPADVGEDAPQSDNIMPLDQRPLPDFPQQGPAIPTGPPAVGPGGMGADGNPAPVPPPAMTMRMRGKPGQAQSAKGQAHPTEQDVNAMIQASARRASKPAAGD